MPQEQSKKEILVNRIKKMLGADVLKIEIPDSTIEEMIQIAVETASPYVSDTKFKTVVCGSCIDLSDCDVDEVIRVIPGVLPNFSMNTQQDVYFDFTAWRVGDILRISDPVSYISKAVSPDIDVPFEYISEKKLLLLTQGITSGEITIEYIPEIYTIEDIRDQRVKKWIYLYALALTKEVLGRIRSKVKSPNVPIELDGETLLQEASTEKSTLENSLEADQFGFIAILR